MSAGNLAVTLRHPLHPGIVALPGGLLLLEASRTLVAADLHFGYEDVIGGSLPLWSTARMTELLVDALIRYEAVELVVLGDIVHGPVMHDGAAVRVKRALDHLRAHALLTLIAGNHEGHSRAVAVLGETVDEVERDGWRLSHGDDAPPHGSRNIIGHLHPSVHLGGGRSATAFLSAPSLIVVPALTPYSPGLNILSRDLDAALEAWLATGDELSVTGVGDAHVYPFGDLTTLRTVLASRGGIRPRTSRRSF